MIVTKTPLRLSLFGGTTDYPYYVERYGGCCVGLALDRYVYTMVKPRHGFGEGQYRVATAELDVVNNLSDIRNQAARACLTLTNQSGCEVIHWADLPARCGVGSSSAFVVGLLNALRALGGVYCGPKKLWREACLVEQVLLLETVGYQDQAWAAFGGIGRMDFTQRNNKTVVGYTPAALSADRLQQFLDHLLVVYLGQQRTASQIASLYATDPEAMNRTHIIRALAEEGWLALVQGDWHKVGSLLDRSWEAKRAVSSHISSTTTDILYSTARVMGAWGGKLMGAGGGGCMAFLVPPDRRQACWAAIQNECPTSVEIPAGVSSSGSRVIYAD